MIFSDKMLTNAEGTVNLEKQITLGDYSCSLPVKLGTMVIEITVIQGKVRVNHNSYNDDGGTYSLPPSNRQPKHYDIIGGESAAIKIEIGEQDGQC